MGKLTKTVVDAYERVYPRKNKYLEELAILQETRDRKAVSVFKAQKNRHPYIVKLRDFEQKEKEFLSGTVERDKGFPGEDKTLLELEQRLCRAQRNHDFYKEYRELSYDAVLKDDMAKAEMHALPHIIEQYRSNKANYDFACAEAQKQNSKEEERLKSEIETYRTEREKQYQQHSEALKKKYEEHLISAKSYRLQKQQLKRQKKDDIEYKKFTLPSVYFANLKKTLEHQWKTELANALKALDGDLSDIRRRTPVEREKTAPIFAYTTWLIPGLGQILNGQKIKGALMLLLNILVYAIAIPYALGYGNYQGNGIAGLIDLGQSGGRLDKSIIFMIEGIIAIFLMILAVAVLFISFHDVRNVEKRKIRGIRPHTFKETRVVLQDKGFPFYVSIPAFLLIVFIVLVPIMTAILLSFTGMDPNHQSKFGWVGLQNYAILARGEGIAGASFWLILWWTLIWTVFSTTLAIFIGFVLALLANNERVRGKGFFRTIYLLPWATPAFITIAFFSIMVSPTGPITQILEKLTGTTILIKNSTWATRIALILLQGWLGSAYIFLLSTGVLQGISNDLYEAADIDGASTFQKVWRITLPLVLFQTAPLLVGQYTFNFNNFSIIYLFNGGGPFDPSKYGNIAGSSDLLISYIYKLTMVSKYQAIGAAVTILISFGLVLFAFIGYRQSKAFKEDK